MLALSPLNGGNTMGLRSRSVELNQELITGLGMKTKIIVTVLRGSQPFRSPDYSGNPNCIRMKNSQASVSEIRNFCAIGEWLGTAGQPSEDQFRTIREAGFEAVINLALPTSDNALAHEGSIVTGLGMSYVHIPVDFKTPPSKDWRAFSRVMGAFDGQRVFVHCAANMRVSAFVFLYRVLYQHVDITEAKHDLQAIWEPNEVWSRFIQNQLESEGQA
jgi:protein tyrosine phosphatase (PTP) superfamily phosphohydrolase (DUF442 family)